MSRLFNAYLARRPAALAFFSGDWGHRGDRRASLDRALAYSGPRAEVAAALENSNQPWLTGIARRRLQAVATGEGVAVVGGQQAGMATGPLYTLLKAITLLKLADRLEADFHVPVLPVFWAATNDSDLKEAGRLTVVDRDHRLQTFECMADGEGARYRGWPVGRVPLEGEGERLTDWIAATLPESEFIPALLESIGNAYHAEATVGEAFVQLLGRWLGPRGLVVLDPLLPALRASCTPLYERVLDDPLSAVESLAVTDLLLRAQRYQRQLSMPPNRLPLFYTGRDRIRRPVIPRGSTFEVEGTGLMERSALLDQRVEGGLDPHAALRPVLQDHLLPTAAFVGGPGEIAYLAQLGPLYERLGVPRPVAVPRERVMLIPRAVAHVLRKYHLDPDAFARGPDPVLRKVVEQQLPEDLEETFARIAVQLQNEMARLTEAATALDSTLQAAFESGEGRMLWELNRLEKKAVTARGRQMDLAQKQINKAAVWLRPDGVPQDRLLSPLPFMARQGMGMLVDRLLEAADVLTEVGVRRLDCP
jgi:bacillithiol synthase